MTTPISVACSAIGKTVLLKVIAKAATQAKIFFIHNHSHVFYFFEKDYNIMITLSAINVNIGNVI